MPNGKADSYHKIHESFSDNSRAIYSASMALFDKVEMLYRELEEELPASEEKQADFQRLDCTDLGFFHGARKVFDGVSLSLDEPDNGLDADTRAWLIHWLNETDQTVVLVSHDPEFVAEILSVRRMRIGR